MQEIEITESFFNQFQGQNANKDADPTPTIENNNMNDNPPSEDNIRNKNGEVNGNGSTIKFKKQQNNKYQSIEYIKMKFIKEADEYQKSEDATVQFKTKEQEFQDELDQLIIQNRQNSVELQLYKQQLEILQTFHFDQFDKSDPQIPLNNINNFRAVNNLPLYKDVDEAAIEQDLMPIVEDKKTIFMMTKDKLHEARQFTNTLQFMIRRLVKERENIRKKVINLEELNQLADINQENIEQEIQEQQTQRSLVKFQFKNIVSLMDKLDKIHNDIREHKTMEAKMREKKLFNTLLEYQHLKQQLESAYDEQQNQLKQIKLIEQQREQKINLNKQIDTLLQNLQQFNQIAKVFIFGNTDEYFDQNLDFLNPHDSDGEFDTNQSNEQSLEEQFSIQHPISSHHNSSYQKLPQHQVQNQQQKTSITKNTNQLEEQTVEKLNIDLSKQTMQNSRESTIMAAGRTPSNRQSQNTENIYRKSKLQQHEIAKKDNKDHLGSSQNIHKNSTKSKHLQLSKKKIDKAQEEKDKMYIINKLNKFYEKHNHNIGKLFDNFVSVFRFLKREEEYFKDQVFEMDFDKQKLTEQLVNLTEQLEQMKLEQEITQQISIIQEQNEGNKDIDIEQQLVQKHLTINIMSFKKNSSDNNNSLEFSFRKIEQIFINILFSQIYLLNKFGQTIRSLLEIGSPLIPQYIVMLVPNIFNFINNVRIREKKMDFLDKKEQLEDLKDVNLKYLFQELGGTLEGLVDMMFSDKDSYVMLSMLFSKLFPGCERALCTWNMLLKQDVFITKFCSKKTFLIYLEFIKEKFTNMVNTHKIDSNKPDIAEMHQTQQDTNIQTSYNDKLQKQQHSSSSNQQQQEGGQPSQTLEVKSLYQQQIAEQYQKKQQQINEDYLIILIFENTYILYEEANDYCKSLCKQIMDQIQITLQNIKQENTKLKKEINIPPQPLNQFLEKSFSLPQLNPMKNQSYKQYINRKLRQIDEYNGRIFEDPYATFQCYDTDTKIKKIKPTNVNILNLIKQQVDQLRRGQFSNTVMDELVDIEKIRKNLKQKYDRVARSLESQRQKTLRLQDQSEIKEEDDDEINNNLVILSDKQIKENIITEEPVHFQQELGISINANNTVNNHESKSQLIQHLKNQKQSIMFQNQNIFHSNAHQLPQQMQPQPNEQKKSDANNQQLQITIEKSKQIVKKQQDHHLVGIKAHERTHEDWNKMIHYDEQFRKVKKDIMNELSQKGKKKKDFDLNQLNMFDRRSKKKLFVTIMKKKKKDKEKEIELKQVKLTNTLQENCGLDDTELDKLGLFPLSVVKIRENNQNNGTKNLFLQLKDIKFKNGQDSQKYANEAIRYNENDEYNSQNYIASEQNMVLSQPSPTTQNLLNKNSIKVYKYGNQNARYAQSPQPVRQNTDTETTNLTSTNRSQSPQSIFNNTNSNFRTTNNAKVKNVVQLAPIQKKNSIEKVDDRVSIEQDDEEQI